MATPSISFDRNQGWTREPYWKDATFYQVYPASFKDSNGDGWGDLPGLISEIDYLAELGVDVIWVSPIFESPQKDMGYDVSDYQKIYEPYGSIEDVDRLLDEAHRRGMKVILDLVVNHTSQEHQWFKESSSSKDNPKRDWYIWKPARYDSETGARKPPTNWRGYFAGPTWTWHDHTQEYYLHLYAPDQPDLNWDNAECREAIYQETMHFWLRRGVDGFRIDTVNKYSKRREFLDAPITDPTSPHQSAPEMWCNGPRIHEFIHEMNRKALAPYNAVSVGELSNTPDPQQVIPYVSARAQELDMVFEFSVIRLGTGDILGPKYIYQPFPLTKLKTLTEKWQSFIHHQDQGNDDAWTTAFIENHDNARAVSRFGDCSNPKFWRGSAKCIALWQTTLTGSLFLYQGQEIGMTNMPDSWSVESEYKDVESQGFYAEALASGEPERIAKTLDGLRRLARDHSRIPFQWNGREPDAGFSSFASTVSTSTSTNYSAATDENKKKSKKKPWMRVHDNYKTINAEDQKGDPKSVLSFYKAALRLRKEHKGLFVFGTFELVDREDETVFAYLKKEKENKNKKKKKKDDDDNDNDTTTEGGLGKGKRREKQMVVVLNMSNRDNVVGPDVRAAMGMGVGMGGGDDEPRLLISTVGDEEEAEEEGFMKLGLGEGTGRPTLRAWEGRVYVNY